MPSLVDILFLSAGYNTALVCIGAALLGAASGAVGVFVLLRKRTLVSDAISHSTLPGVALAFIVGELFFGVGRSLPVLLVGAALSAGIGVLAVDWIRSHTRLTEDTAIGTVLSTFFALGMVLLTVIQSMSVAGRAGLEGFLLGATSGMTYSEAMIIAIAAVVVGFALLLRIKEFTILCFDEGFAAASGYNVTMLDRTLLLLLLAVVVIGLKTVGLVLIIALAIIPPVAARFWSERVPVVVALSAAIGAVGSYLGAAISASAPDMPTGGIIVLVLFSFFVVSLIGSPVRGLLAAYLRHRRFQGQVHMRQGLLSIAHDEPILEPVTRKLLVKARFMEGDGRVTPTGYAQARVIARDQALWNLYKQEEPDEAATVQEWSLKLIQEVLPPDTVKSLENKLGARVIPVGV
ncbi:metal ABC transporter permease [Rhodobacteraceae bacterium RKSG542]|uniref:metal ABC transporter permease n=1 Tax=Pseudovibrio flavus TaxID=2529854 RepID=UPI0012BB501A|nr:metal ABC transporter permease [Pseudovibrio flavus]MTI18755.1 metal ABC transporter permease [Pseudovibrio flavus]